MSALRDWIESIRNQRGCGRTHAWARAAGVVALLALFVFVATAGNFLHQEAFHADGDGDDHDCAFCVTFQSGGDPAPVPVATGIVPSDLIAHVLPCESRETPAAVDLDTHPARGPPTA